MNGVDAFAQGCEISGVLDHRVRDRQPVRPSRLAVDHGGNRLRATAVTGCRARGTKRARRIHDDDPIHPAGLVRLHEQGNHEHDVGCIARRRERLHRVAYPWMQNRFEPGAFGVVAEDSFAHPSAIEAPVPIENTGSECVHDLRQGGRTGLDQPAGDDIGVNHRHAEFLEPPRNRALSAGEPAGESDDHGALAHHVVPVRNPCQVVVTASPQ